MEVTDKDGVIVSAVVTTEHSASSYGQPVLVVDGEALGSAEADALGLVVTKCTLEEWVALYRGRYYGVLQRAPKSRVTLYFPTVVVEALEDEVMRRRRREGDRRINVSLVASVLLAAAEGLT